MREVAEECNVQVALRQRICHTYHAMAPKRGIFSLKKTHWYAMDLVEDADMRPRREEGIEQTQWVGASEMQEVLKGAYPSVVHTVRTHKVLGGGLAGQGIG